MDTIKNFLARFYIPMGTFFILSGSYFLRFGVNVFIARILGAALFGDYIITIRILIILSNVALVGTNITSSRYLPIFYKERNFKSAQDYFRWNFSVIVLSFLICLIIAVIAFLIMYILHFYDIKNLKDYYLPVYSLWIVPIVALFLLFSSLLLAQNYNLSSAFFKNILNLLLIFAAFYVVYYLLGIKATNINIIVILGGVFLIITILQAWILFRQNKGFAKLFINSFKLKNIKITNDWLTFSYRIVISNIAYYLLSVIDLMIVEIVVPSENQVGYYAAVLTITLFIWMIPNALYRFIKPAIAANLEEKSNRLALQKSIKEINILNVLMSVFFTLLIIYYSKNLLNFFGSGYEKAQTALIIAACAFFIGTFAKSPVILLIFAGYEKLLIYVTVTELTTLTVLGGIFAYFWGIEGVAMATFIAITIKTTMAYIFAKTKIKLEPWAFF